MKNKTETSYRELNSMKFSKQPINCLIFDEITPISLEDKEQGERQKSYMRVNMSRKWEAKPFAIYFYSRVEKATTLD